MASSEGSIICNICLKDQDYDEIHQLEKCLCIFCKMCLNKYIKFEIMAGAYKIICPGSECWKNTAFSLNDIQRWSFLFKQDPLYVIIFFKRVY